MCFPQSWGRSCLDLSLSQVNLPSVSLFFGNRLEAIQILQLHNWKGAWVSVFSNKGDGGWRMEQGITGTIDFNDMTRNQIKVSKKANRRDKGVQFPDKHHSKDQI